MKTQRNHKTPNSKIIFLRVFIIMMMMALRSRGRFLGSLKSYQLYDHILSLYIKSFPTRPLTSQMSWFVISDILVLHFLLNSYIQNLFAPDIKERNCLFKFLEDSLKAVSNVKTDKNTRKW